MPDDSTAVTEAPAKDEQVLLRLDADEKAELVRRAGEVQVRTGVITSVQDYIRSQLWPGAD